MGMFVCFITGHVVIADWRSKKEHYTDLLLDCNRVPTSFTSSLVTLDSFGSADVHLRLPTLKKRNNDAT